MNRAASNVDELLNEYESIGNSSANQQQPLMQARGDSSALNGRMPSQAVTDMSMDQNNMSAINETHEDQLL